MNERALRRHDDTPAPSVPRAFECNVTYLDDSARVVATGWLDVSTVPVLRRSVLAAAMLPISGITLDLAGVESLDRYAVTALVALLVAVRDRGAAFRLAVISEPVRRAIDRAGMSDRFTRESVWSAYPSPDPQS